MDPVTPTILWWHWVTLGLVLIGLELVVPSFTIVWFGLGACLAGLIVLLAPGAPLALQIPVWAAASGGCTWFWFRYFKPKVITAEATREAITRVTAALGDRDLPAVCLLGERYIEAVRTLAQSSHAKTLMLPADVLRAVQGMLGRDRV